MKKPAIVILAAGSSSRMGEAKQLLPFRKTTLLGTVIQNCKSLEVDSIYCVLGAKASEIEAAHSKLEINFIKNSDYENGLSSSIGKAVEYILETEPTITGLLFLLADQPYIDDTQLEKYIKLHTEHPSQVIATAYNKGNGVPALFPKNHLKSLLVLKGDSGAKDLLATLTGKILVHLPKESLIDIDTQEEYQNTKKDASHL